MLKESSTSNKNGHETGMENILERREIDRCTGIIDAMIRTTNTEIDSIKTSNEKKERDRRFGEELKRQERYQKIQMQSMKTARKNAELEMRWSEYREMEECQELFDSLNLHKRLFRELIDSKTSLINELLEVLRNKDGEYNKSIEDMKIEIDVICESMRKQFGDLRQMSLRELQNIENNMIDQRTKMIEENSKAIRETFQEHSRSEKLSVKKRQDDQKKNKKILEEEIIKSEKSFASMKIRSETEIQNCEKCFEDMRALYQLNSAKLIYNFKVLSEKNTENTQLKTDLTKRRRHFQVIYNKKVDEYEQKDKKYKKRNKELTELYKKISRQYKDLHIKFKHFKKTDVERYNEIKDMNLKEIQTLKDKIIRCDRIIHMQQLGVVWEPPAVAKELDETGEEQDELQIGSQGHLQSVGSSNKNLSAEEVKKAQESSMDEDKSNVEEDEGQYDLPAIQMHAILNVIIDETDFLLDDKIMSEIYKAPSKEKLLLKMNVLRKVLAISDPMEFKKLLYQIYLSAYPDHQARMSNVRDIIRLF